MRGWRCRDKLERRWAGHEEGVGSLEGQLTAPASEARPLVAISLILTLQDAFSPVGTRSTPSCQCHQIALGAPPSSLCGVDVWLSTDQWLCPRIQRTYLSRSPRPDLPDPLESFSPSRPHTTTDHTLCDGPVNNLCLPELGQGKSSFSGTTRFCNPVSPNMSCVSTYKRSETTLYCVSICHVQSDVSPVKRDTIDIALLSTVRARFGSCRYLSFLLLVLLVVKLHEGGTLRISAN